MFFHNPYLRLLFITLNSIFWVAIVIMGLRFLGSQQEFTSYDHPLLKSEILTFTKIKSATDLSLPNLKTYQRLKIIPILDINHIDGEWSIVNIIKARPLEFKNISNLENFLNNSPLEIVAFNVKSPYITALNSLDKIINKKNSKNKINIFTSTNTSLIREARKQQPTWLYIANHNFLAKFKFLGAIFLENIISIKEDIILLSEQESLSDRLLAELKNRNKIIIKTYSQEIQINSKFNGHLFNSATKATEYKDKEIK